MSNPRTLADYVAILRRRKWVVLPSLLIVPLVAVLLTALQQTTYRASSEVLLSRQNLAATLAGIPDVLPYQDPERLLATQTSLARAPAVAERAVKAAGVPRSPGQLLGSSSVLPKGSSDVLVFSVTDDDPEVAVKLANAYGREFTIYRQEIDTLTLRQTRTELTTRIRELEDAGLSKDSDLYSSLVAKEDQLRTFEALQTSNTYVSQLATAAEPVEPPVKRSGIVGALLGMTLGLAFAFAWEALDRRIRSGAEMEDILGMPLLARLPTPPRSARKLDRVAMLTEPQGLSAEAFRTLRTNLDFISLDTPLKTILVTSGAQQEGKSTTAANLAAAFAVGGQRTVVVDLDLRRPFLHHLFHIESTPGLTDVALGRVPLADALERVPVSGGQRLVSDFQSTAGNGNRDLQFLQVLPAGSVPPSPGEFIRTRALADVLMELRSLVDVVVIDTPPLLAVGDTLALTPHADGILLVSRPSVARRPMLGEVARVLANAPGRKLGFVTTASEDQEAYLYGGYSYAEGRASAAPAPREVAR